MKQATCTYKHVYSWTRL